MEITLGHLAALAVANIGAIVGVLRYVKTLRDDRDDLITWRSEISTRMSGIEGRVDKHQVEDESAFKNLRDFIREVKHGQEQIRTDLAQLRGELQGYERAMNHRRGAA